ncbi:MAG TPA: hypothetical protein VGI10_17500 [Polyangiaceae bacterium]
MFRGIALSAFVLLVCVDAHASPKRHFFEPDDLELEHPGVLDLDLQVGPVWGNASGGNRLVLPDFEIDLGLGQNVELGIDGTFGFDHVNHASRHYTGDPLWIAPKLGLLDLRDDDGSDWALGVEFGPRFPTLDSVGIGYGTLALLGYSKGGAHLVLNTGGLIDPGSTVRDHSESLLNGLDFDLDFNRYWSLQGEFSLAYYLSHEPAELVLTAGMTYAVNDDLDLSVTVLGGFLPDTDHVGLLFGVSPKTALW